MDAKSYKNLIVWQKSKELVLWIYKLSEHFPRMESFGLTMQMRRAAVSIPSNIAEGSRRGSRKDFRHFLLMAYGSGAELETQLEIAKSLKYGDLEMIGKVEKILDEVMRMLNSFSGKLRV
jgi:four helix bundle protein